VTESLSSVLRDWVAANSLQAVSFKEISSPTRDLTEDYQVRYEAHFRPPRSDQAQIDIVLTENDFIGVGFDTRANVANRLNVRNMRQGYAAGFEPCEKREDELLRFLDLVRQGKIAILARCWPIVGLGKTRAAVNIRDVPSGFVFGPHGWLRPLADPKAATMSSRVLRYETWS
jgi:hypothetical protein